MKVQFSVVGADQVVLIPTIESTSVPREGELVSIDGVERYVRTVVWFPAGAAEEGIEEPFVYVVIGPERKR